MAKAYVIEPKTDRSGFTMTTPYSSQPFGFPTTEAALAKIKAEVGEDEFSRATITKRHDGGINVYFP